MARPPRAPAGRRGPGPAARPVPLAARPAPAAGALLLRRRRPAGGVARRTRGPGAAVGVDPADALRHPAARRPEPPPGPGPALPPPPASPPPPVLPAAPAAPPP